jgi:endonuclease G, mitochondrial
MSSREVTLTVPLSITVRIGDGPAATELSERFMPELAEEAARPRSYYQGYTGYDPEFLSIPVMLSQNSKDAEKNVIFMSEKRQLVTKFSARSAGGHATQAISLGCHRCPMGSSQALVA